MKIRADRMLPEKCFWPEVVRPACVGLQQGGQGLARHVKEGTKQLDRGQMKWAPRKLSVIHACCTPPLCGMDFA